MTVIATKSDVLSSVLLSDANALVENYNYAVQLAEEAAETVYTIGQVVRWDTDAWKIVKTADFTTNALNTTASLVGTAGNKLAVVVGFEGLGKDGMSKTLAAATATQVVVAYRGIAALKESGLVFAAGVTAPQIANAKLILTQQGFDLKPVAAELTTSFYGA